MAPPKGNKYAVGNNGGVPKTYTKEWLEKEAQAFLDWMELPDSIFFKSFAIERGYSPQRLTEFADQSNVFAEVLKRAKGWQESKLVKGGLRKEYDSSITKFVLVNHHGYKEKSEISGDQTNPLAVVLEKIAAQNAAPLNPD